MEDERTAVGGISGAGAPMLTLPPRYLALGAVAALVISIGWSAYSHLSTSAQELQAVAAAQSQASSSAADAAAAAAATSSVSQVGPQVLSALEDDFVSLQSSGSYSSAAAESDAQQLAADVSAPVPYHTYTLADVKTTSDTSTSSILSYREALQAATAVIATGTTPEFQYFAEYVQTGDASYLAQLADIANNYETAASATARLVVPQSAASYQVDILNAMEQFAAVLRALAQNGTDPITSTILLENYEQAESGMFSSFNALGTFFAPYASSTTP